MHRICRLRHGGNYTASGCCTQCAAIPVDAPTIELSTQQMDELVGAFRAGATPATLCAKRDRLLGGQQARYSICRVDDGVHGGGAADGFGADFAEADVTHVAGLDHVGDRADGFFNGDVGIEPGAGR